MTQKKYARLLEYLRRLQRAAIAFSGGVDSTFLLAAAFEAIGDNALAVIAKSPTYPKREYDQAIELAVEIGVPYVAVETNELADPAFASNPPSRCYVCKTELMRAVKEAVAKRGIDHILLGNNADDTSDYRPGMDAAAKLGAKSPLMELGFTKAEIRALSKDMGLKTWNKPVMACLSSRIPYGEEISVEKLRRIEVAENAVCDLGIAQLRVRDHGNLARLEVSPEDIPKLAEPDTRSKLVLALKKAGYSYICLDLQGYRTGSMNEVLFDTEVKSSDPCGENI